MLAMIQPDWSLFGGEFSFLFCMLRALQIAAHLLCGCCGFCHLALWHAPGSPAMAGARFEAEISWFIPQARHGSIQPLKSQE